MVGKRGRITIISRRRAPVGAPPGTLYADPSVAPPPLDLFAFDGAGLDETPDATLEDVKAALDTGRTVWLDVGGVGNADYVGRIGALFGLDPLALEDVMNLHQRPKVEDFDKYTYVVVHMLAGESLVTKEQFSVFLGKNFVLTFQETPVDCLDAVRDRLRRAKGHIREAGADYLAYAIIDAVVDAYFPMIEKLGDRLEALEDLIVADPRPHHINELHGVKRELLAAKRSLWPSREVMAALRDEDNEFVSKNTRHYLRDTHDHVMQLIDIVETYRELATGLLDLYLSSLSNRMNEVMKVLTIIATIFIPLSFLAGVWGMNFAPDASPWNMPELRSAYGYPAALGLMAAVAIGLMGWFKWKRWF